MEPSVKAIEGCDSECYTRHHLCAVREVRRLRKLVDELVGSPKVENATRYETLEAMYLGQCKATDEWAERARDAEAALKDPTEMVPAAWLARANSRIEELSGELAMARVPHNT